MIKIVFCLRRRADLSREEFQAYWRTTHAPLVRAHAEALGIRRYVQVHSIDDAVSMAVAGSRARSPEPFDGVAELWLDSLDALDRVRQQRRRPGRGGGAARRRAALHRPRTVAAVPRRGERGHRWRGPVG